MNSLQSFRNLIFSSTVDKGLDLATHFIRDINTSGSFYLNMRDIEEDLITKFLSLNNIDFKHENLIKNQPLFLISQGYSTGGHTRLMENLSIMVPDKTTLLITRPTQINVLKKFEECFEKIIICLKEDNNIGYVLKIAKEILKYEKVVLNTHPDDIFAIVACGVAKRLNSKLKFYFVNHADHLATYGVAVADVWYGISLYGQTLDKARGLSFETQTCFLGIPIHKPKKLFFKNIEYRYSENRNKFLTAAAGHKYNPIQGNSIIPLLERLLIINPRNEIVVIGSGVSSNSLFIELKLKYPSRLSFHASLAHDKYILLTSDCDFYIDSFPLPGGTAFVEQFIHGKPCIGLTTKFFGYTPLEMLKENSIDRVIYSLEQPPSSELITKIQSKIFEVHGFEKVKERFISSLYEGLSFENPMLDCIEKKSILKGHNFEISRNSLMYIYNLDKAVFLKLIFSRKIIIKIYKILSKKTSKYI